MKNLATIVVMALLALITLGQEQRPRRTNKGEAKEQKPVPNASPSIVEEPSAAIRISSNLVAVPVSVTDSAGRPVKNLTAQDFRLEEEGEIQTVSLLGQLGKTPVDLALLFDISGSVQERFQFEQQAAARFLRAVVTSNDQASVFSIGPKPKLVVSRTNNLEQVIAGTMAITPTKEATAFFDTVARAAHYLGERPGSGVKRVIVVISDGEDNQSESYNLEGSLRELQRNDCLFYSINPSGPSIKLNKISLKGQDAMIALAAETGGVAFLPDKLEELDTIFRQIAVELQAQYLIGYYSTKEAADGNFRRITVRVPNRSELRVRARQGYYAPRE